MTKVSTAIAPAKTGATTPKATKANGKKLVAAVNPSKPTGKAATTTKPKANTAKAKPKTTGKYGAQVLCTNAALKVHEKSLGGARARLLSAHKNGVKRTVDSKQLPLLNPIQVKLLEASKKPANYKILESFVRATKSGNYPVFYLLQCLAKNEKALQDKFK